MQNAKPLILHFAFSISHFPLAKGCAQETRIFRTKTLTSATTLNGGNQDFVICASTSEPISDVLTLFPPAAMSDVR